MEDVIRLFMNEYGLENSRARAYMEASGIEEHVMDFMVLLHHLACFLKGLWIKARPVKQITEAGSFDIDRRDGGHCVLKRQNLWRSADLEIPENQRQVKRENTILTWRELE